jgi:O-antigen/teichoic acid export membrane protein
MARKLSSGRNIWALGDQALISGTNFVTTILVARGLDSRQEFGYFSNVYSALLFANILQTALITQPHNVLGTSRFTSDRAGYVRYTSTIGYAQLLLAALLSMLALLLLPTSRFLGWQVETSLLLALVPSIAAWQLQEFVRRVLYSEQRTGAALINDIISYGGQTIGIALLFWQQQLSATRAMYVLAITSAAAAAFGLFQLRGSIMGRIDPHAWAENWNFGKWLVGSELLSWLSSIQMYMYIAAALVGAAASGELRAVQTLYGPARVISFFLATVLPIQFAHVLSSSGPRAMHRQLMSITMKVLPVMAVYCLMMALFAGPLLGLFGRAFTGQHGILELYSLVAFLTYAQMMVAAALTAKRRTRYIFMGSVWGAAIALLIGTMMIKLLGVYGALVGMLLTAATVCTLYWKAYRSTISPLTDDDGEVRADVMAPAMGAEDQQAVIGEAGA